MEEYRHIVEVITHNSYERILYEEICRMTERSGLHINDISYSKFLQIRDYLDQVNRYRIQNQLKLSQHGDPTEPITIPADSAENETESEKTRIRPMTLFLFVVMIVFVILFFASGNCCANTPWIPIVAITAFTGWLIRLPGFTVSGILFGALVQGLEDAPKELEAKREVERYARALRNDMWVHQQEWKAAERQIHR